MGHFSPVSVQQGPCTQPDSFSLAWQRLHLAACASCWCRVWAYWLFPDDKKASSSQPCQRGQAKAKGPCAPKGRPALAASSGLRASGAFVSCKHSATVNFTSLGLQRPHSFLLLCVQGISQGTPPMTQKPSRLMAMISHLPPLSPTTINHAWLPGLTRI